MSAFPRCSETDKGLDGRVYRACPGGWPTISKRWPRSMSTAHFPQSGEKKNAMQVVICCPLKPSIQTARLSVALRQVRENAWKKQVELLTWLQIPDTFGLKNEPKPQPIGAEVVLLKFIPASHDWWEINLKNTHPNNGHNGYKHFSTQKMIWTVNQLLAQKSSAFESDSDHMLPKWSTIEAATATAVRAEGRGKGRAE